MSERKYSLSEIDRMRAAVKRLMLGKRHWYSTGPSGFATHPQRSPEAGEIEDQLRTYMANGTSPLELEAAVAEIERAERAQMESEPRTA